MSCETWWGDRYGSGFTLPRDVDVPFFDASDLSRANDLRATDLLLRRLPDVPWEAKNQAAVHTWYTAKFGGGEVEPPAHQRRGVARAAPAAPAEGALAGRHGRPAVTARAAGRPILEHRRGRQRATTRGDAW